MAGLGNTAWADMAGLRSIGLKIIITFPNHYPVPGETPQAAFFSYGQSKFLQCYSVALPKRSSVHDEVTVILDCMRSHTT